MRVQSLNQHNAHQLVQMLSQADQLEPIPDVSIEKRETTYTILEENISQKAGKGYDPGVQASLNMSQGSSSKQLEPHESIQ